MENRRRCVLIMLDGLGDRSYEDLRGLTPLQAARTPVLDYLAAKGASGLFHALSPGVVLPSENAHFAMFGYPEEEFPGRGLLEALGGGIRMSDNTVAMLAHFVGLKRDGNVLELSENRPMVSGKEVGELLKALPPLKQKSISIEFHQTEKLDGVLSLEGKVSPLITDVDCLQAGSPLIEPRPLKGAENDPAARATAAALKKYLTGCFQKLDVHPLNLSRRKQGFGPVNGIVTQRPGQWKKIEPFSDKWGLRGLSLSSGIMYQGLGSFIGIDVMKMTDSADPGADLAARLIKVLELKTDYDFFHVHTKAPDQAAHTKIPENKVEAIESLDRGLGKVVDAFLDRDTVLVVAADHSTPSSGPQIHSGEEVPLTVNGPGIRKDRVESFDEVSCAAGCLGQIRGRDFMYLVLNWLDRAKLYGLRDTPDDQPYWPGEREQFLLTEEREAGNE